jgi:hypothetical protein
MVAGRDMVSVADRNTFKESDKLRQIAIGERFDQSCVDKGEDGGAGGYAKRKYYDRSDGKARAFAELTDGETKDPEVRFRTRQESVFVEWLRGWLLC